MEIPTQRIWQGGAALAYGPDSSGTNFIYLKTANGSYDGSSNWGDSFMKLDPTTLTVPAGKYFAPARHCCKSIPRQSNVSHVMARYALCGSENCGASAHLISTRGLICGCGEPTIHPPQPNDCRSSSCYHTRMIATHWAAFSGEKAVVRDLREPPGSTQQDSTGNSL